jgi:hypothetical protein
MERKLISKIKQNLTKIKNINEEKNEAIVHALVDIQESFEKIYLNIIPQLSAGEISEDLAQDLLWDIREELRHIDYHIHDTDLLEL